MKTLIASDRYPDIRYGFKLSNNNILTQHEDKKITAAAYAYQVDNGGAWGEIQFDLKEKTSWVETFAENDPCDTWEITDAAIHLVFRCRHERLPKSSLIPIMISQ